MAQNDKNDIDSLFEKDNGGSSDDNGGKGAQGDQGTPEVIEANGRKYDMSKPEDVKAMAQDYRNLNDVHAKQSTELGELRKKVDTKPEDEGETTDPNAPTPEQIKAQEEYDKQLLKRYGVTFKEDIEEQKYEDGLTASVNKFAQSVGAPVEDLLNEVKENNKNTGVKLDPSHIEDYYAAKHPKEFREARQKAIREDHPGNHYTESVSKGGMELPEGEVPQFGKNVLDQGLELVGQSSGE